MLDLRHCTNCGEPFMPSKHWQKYCSPFCNKAAYYKRNSPPNVLTPPTGPSQTQEEDWKNRKDPEPPEASPNKAETLQRAQEMLDNPEPQSPLKNLGYGKDESKP